MTDTLRDRQKQVARDLILQAAADEIVEGGLENLSLQAVADRAAVSKRTLYNYFDSRETLLAAIGEWSDELTIEMGGYLVPGRLDVLPSMVRAVWKTWYAQGTIYEAVMMIDAAARTSGVSEGRRARRTALAAAVGDVRPELSDAERSDVAALLHGVASAPVFRRLTSEDGLDIDTATGLIAWALTALRESLVRGDDPFPKEDTT